MVFFGWSLLALLAVLHLDSGAVEAFDAPNGSYIANARNLYDYLMKGYKTSILPRNSSRETVTVRVSLSSYSIDDLDEKRQAFKIGGYMFETWKDFGLVWNPKEFDNMDTMRIAVSDIWTPDITLYNSKNAYYNPPTHYMAHVSSNGDVFWVPQVNIETHCELDLTDFPFDEHVCKVVFGSWTHDDLAVNITSSDVNQDSESLVDKTNNENLEWKLVKVTVERNAIRYPCCPHEIYPDVTYNFTIRRRSAFATHLFIGPSVMLCLVTPVVFLLPPGSGEKTMLGIGILITDTLLLGELINYIPTAHPNLPLIAKFFVGNIVMASLSLLISAIIIGFWDKSTSRLTGPHAFFRLIFLGPLATILRVKKEDLFSSEDISGDGALEINPDGEVGTESTSEVDPGTEKKRRFMNNYLRNLVRSEWRQLAIVFDRLFLILFYLILIILTLSFARYM